MEFSAKDLAKVLNGTIEGDENVKVSNFSKIEEGKPGTITFLSNPKYEPYIYETEASIVLVNNDFTPSKPISATLLRVPNAYMALATLLKFAEGQKPSMKGISSLAYIAPTAKLGNNVAIGAFAYISDNVTIGDNTQVYPGCFIGENVEIGCDNIIYPNVSVYYGCKIMNRCIIHASTVIGADGFGFAKNEAGQYEKMPQNGIVIINDDVEVGASTTIDRGSMGTTILAKGVKLDNQIQIAHNVEVGENTAMAACTGVAGSTKIGKNCILAGKVGVIGHADICDNVIIAADSSVSKAITEPGVYQGAPAVPLSKAKRAIAVYKNLPEMQKSLNEMQKQIAQLQEELNNLKNR